MPPTLPPLTPDKSLAGIAVDPRSLDRVIPESKRPDGTLRKQIKIRPGYTPQEDVRRFRGTKQAQMDQIALPKGHIIGWTPPPTSSAPKAKQASTTTSMSGEALSKNAKKRQKQREKKVESVKDNWDDDDEEEGEKKVEAVKDNWDDDDDDEEITAPTSAKKKATGGEESDGLAEKLEKLEVR
ncbi:hypothetical protein FIBSPDRAFT_924893 [Athelia psychrophila]|uniref:WIBG Mago-binding domain-containing protein n=1 Tax=Athelia psychrophila TaxID=1759441 RepID=A0A166VML7_9AGAM|nr:hypothetical protein FIBSPDRAFT_924893 [Fibularhizoctonia sp. CBS 109695]